MSSPASTTGVTCSSWPANASPQPGLDIGQMVQVQSWGPDGTARVAYRGSTWDAELAATGVPQAKTMYIAAMRGSVLILSDRRPDAPQQL